MCCALYLLWVTQAPPSLVCHPDILFLLFSLYSLIHSFLYLVGREACCSVHGKARRRCEGESRLLPSCGSGDGPYVLRLDSECPHPPSSLSALTFHFYATARGLPTTIVLLSSKQIRFLVLNFLFFQYEKPRSISWYWLGSDVTFKCCSYNLSLRTWWQFWSHTGWVCIWREAVSALPCSSLSSNALSLPLCYLQHSSVLDLDLQLICIPACFLRPFFISGLPWAPSCTS